MARRSIVLLGMATSAAHAAGSGSRGVPVGTAASPVTSRHASWHTVLWLEDMPPPTSSSGAGMPSGGAAPGHRLLHSHMQWVSVL